MTLWLDDDQPGGNPEATPNEFAMRRKGPAVAGTEFHVIVRLVDGDRIYAGTFPDRDEADRAAQDLMNKFARADGDWPVFDGRYLRPSAVVSVELTEEEHRRWGGSPDRARIADVPDASS